MKKTIFFIFLSSITNIFAAQEPQAPVQRLTHQNQYEELAWIEYRQAKPNGQILRALYNTDCTFFKAELQINADGKKFTAQYDGDAKQLFQEMQAKFKGGKDLDHINYNLKPYDRKVCIIQ